jgi:hypothetical protein
LIIGESIGEMERDDDTDERISLPKDDDGDIEDEMELHGELSGYSSCKK